MTGILGPEAVKELATIRRIAKALEDVMLSPHASVSPGDGAITLSQESSEETAIVLRGVGTKLAAAAEGLATAIETQMAEFFNYMREKETLSVVAMLRARSVVPEGFKLMSHEEVCAARPTAFSCNDDTSEPSGGGVLQTTKSLHSQRSQMRVAASSLQTCLFLMLEALLTRVHATRAAVYLENLPENSHVLSRVAQIHADGRLPLEVSYASSSMIVTAVRCGMAINFNNTGMPPNNNDNDFPHHIERNVRRPLPVQNGIIVPIGNYGCVFVADKVTGVPPPFTSFDEYQVWALASLCEGIFSRYSRDVFVTVPWSPAVGTLRQCTCLPPLPRPPRDSTQPKAAVTAAVTAPSLDALQSMPKRLAVLRASTNKVSIIGDSKGIPRTHLTFEGLFLEAAEYVRNIEDLWHKSVDEVNQLQISLREQTRNLDAKTHQILGLEREVRRLNGRLLRLQETTATPIRRNVT
ncbi:hypothetical protein TraAM80_03479 [Trypanosoma rangeli]|uniref:GAF domain-containing protein n=1 Tax=Trypanosoma rangeli TaxID=5698 RepID=A0A422NNQ9_TRYRA|nr:uncharacterized protein TraAM80_03479 [Trypanosoma rangeli]RNF07127.1 hypothetical protein TraAM80_03479 [Trypanosoma rangeli]|eukprot:RNF07127.1 hypothetical protein TraAM80_03479 [Trypanosoma rangeli]